MTGFDGVTIGLWYVDFHAMQQWVQYGTSRGDILQ